MDARTIATPTVVTDDALTLGIAPALTPSGLETHPSFFHGFASHPQVIARSLVVLADITATRYFQPTSTIQRDPVLSAHGDRLRAECFSACNGVYARLDLLASGLDGGEVSHGTTNVDLGPDTRRALTSVGAVDLFHLDVGTDGLTISTLEGTSRERPVAMPDRWVGGLGTVAELHRGLRPVFALDTAATRGFLSSLPPATSTGHIGWLTPQPRGAKLLPRRRGEAVRVSGLHRLSALRRLLTHATGLTAYSDPDRPDAAAVIELRMPDASMVIGLTAEEYRGHSSEGSLLEGLASTTARDDADLIAALLAFEPVIDVTRLAREAGFTEPRTLTALTVLAAQGRVGWDLSEGAHFHRELPTEEARIERDHPRLKDARRLAAGGAVSRTVDGWRVRSGDHEYLVRDDDRAGTGRCTCTWSLLSAASRGPCKHVLAAQIVDAGTAAAESEAAPGTGTTL